MESYQAGKLSLIQLSAAARILLIAEIKGSTPFNTAHRQKA
jgi:hypothetical protein